MANKEKKWTVDAELDLAIAIIKSNTDGKPRYNWPVVEEQMKKAGYDFTRDAMSQHWTKSVIRKSDARTGASPAKTDGKTSPPSTAASSPTPGSTGKKKQARAPAKAKKQTVKDEDIDLKAEPAGKKRKMEDLDDDPLGQRERSLTLDVDFDA